MGRFEKKVGLGLENLYFRAFLVSGRQNEQFTDNNTDLYIRSKAGISSAFPFVSKMSKRPLEYPDTKKDRI